jgi:alkylation response protein AidB-like acyl-CoA dehydrogenase
VTDAFRAEVRDWLAAHVPATPLPSLDTAEGFEAHRARERSLAAARLAVVTCPAAYGGRDAALAEWLVFEEEYHTARAPARVGHACAEAAYRAARAALQVHGAIGYTAEHELSLFLLQVRALAPAWGTSAERRARVLRELGR